jgi:hypothetical protein
MRVFQAIASALLILTLVLPARGRPGQPSPESDGAYGSPKAVFDAMNQATKKKDHKTLLKCVSPASRDLLFASLASEGFELREISAKRRDTKDLADKYSKALAKHGLTKEAVSKYDAATDPKELAKAAKAVAALVKDKPAFMGEMSNLGEKFAEIIASGTILDPVWELKDLKIDGDKARGKMVMKIGDREESDPIEFVKIGGGWYIVPDIKPRAEPKKLKGPPADKK